MDNLTGATLGDMIEANARKYPNQTAFVWQDRRVTHSEFRARAAKLASALARLGLKRQDRVAILSQNRLEFHEVYGAIELSGLIAATVNWRLAVPEMLHIINDGGARVLIYEADYSGAVAEMRLDLWNVEHFVCIDGPESEALGYEDLIATGDPSDLPYRSRPEDIAYLIYTSGTTGKPKGVMLTQEGSVAGAEILGSDQRNGPNDRLLIMMPLFHIGAKIIQNAQHWRAGTVVLQRGFDPQAVLRTLEEERITVTHMAPTMVQTLLEAPEVTTTDLSHLRMVVYAAAPMPLTVLRKGLKLMGPVFQQQFGQTEGPGTTLLTHQHRPDGTDRDREILGSVGQASPRVQIKIVDEDGDELPEGEVGEILLSSPARMKGYWNNHAATIETLRDGWVHTGDMGRLDHEGFLFLVDRKKDMVISGGENIYSREVEEALMHHPSVFEAAVIAVPDEKWGEAVKAIVSLRKDAPQPTSEDLIAHCRTRIASYKKPRHIQFVDDIDKLPNGKIDKVTLRRLYGIA